jgi:hypothetical protein
MMHKILVRLLCCIGSIGLLSHGLWAQETPQLGFEMPIQIADATADKNSPVLAIDSAGNIVLAWTQLAPGSSYAVWTAYYTKKADTWSTPKQLSSFGNITINPEIAMDGNGNVIVAWLVNSQNVYAAYFDASAGWANGWTQEKLLGNGVINSICIAMDDTGNGMVVWPQLFSGIRARYFTKQNFTLYGWDNAWTDTYTISETLIPTQANVTFDGLGNTIVVWNNIQLGELLSARYESEQGWPAGWSVPTTISSDIAPSSFPVIAASNATQGDYVGNAMVVWLSPNNTSVQACLYTNNTGWQAPVSLTSDISIEYIVPHVAMDNNGNAVALWQQNTANESSIYSTQFTAATDSWDLPATRISPVSQNTESPNLAMDTNGHAIATWYRTKENPDTTIDLIIQASQNKTDGTWYLAHDISLIGLDGFAPNIAINNTHQAAASWGFPQTNLFVSRAYEVPELVSKLVTLGTASAFSVSSNGEGVFFVDIISNGIVYTFVHYPDTAETAWEQIQVSPDSLFAYEIAGSTDGYGNHGIAYTARTRTTTENPDITAYLATFTRTTRTRRTTTTTTRTRSVSEFPTTIIISEPGQLPVLPRIGTTTTTTRTTRIDDPNTINITFCFIDSLTRTTFTGRTTTTTTRSPKTTRQAVELEQASPEEAMLTQLAVSNTFARAYLWLIPDATITRAQANYAEPADLLIGYRYLSEDGLDLVSTITPVVQSDSFGATLFAWIATDSTDGSFLVQATSFRALDPEEQWNTFDPVANTETLDRIPAETAVESLAFTIDSAGNSILTWTIQDQATPISYRFDHTSNIWQALTATRTRSVKTVDKFLRDPDDLEDLIEVSIPAIGLGGSRGTRTTTTTTRTRRRTRNNILTKALSTTETPTTTIEIAQVNGFTEEIFNPETFTVEGYVTNIGAATNWNGTRQITTLTRTTRTTTTRGTSADDPEDILHANLHEPALPKPGQATDVQVQKHITRLPRRAITDNCISWRNPAAEQGTPATISYAIYVFPDLDTPVATVAADESLTYCQHNINPCSQYIYYIYSIDAQGTRSNPVIVTIK